MRCKYCGYNNTDGAVFCTNCGKKLKDENVNPINNVEDNNNNYQGPIQENTNNNYQNQNYGEYQTMPNYNDQYYGNDEIEFDDKSAVLSLVLSIFCCFNVPGMVLSSIALLEGKKVENYLSQGRVEYAKESLKKANMLIKIAYILIIVTITLSMLQLIFAIMRVYIEKM